MNYTDKIEVWLGIVLLVCLFGAFIFFTISAIIDKIKEKRKEKQKNAIKKGNKSKSDK